jgi:hypothetical protein
MRIWSAVCVGLCSSFFVASPALAQVACPPGQRPSLSGCVDGSSNARARGAVGPETKAALKRVPKPDPALALERARPSARERASRRLLMGELLRLESVLRSMPLNAPDRPLVLRRLAEGYAELETLAERERARASAAAEAAEKLARD